MPKLTRRLTDTGGKAFTFAMVSALVMAYFADLAGLHPCDNRVRTGEPRYAVAAAAIFHRRRRDGYSDRGYRFWHRFHSCGSGAVGPSCDGAGHSSTFGQYSQVGSQIELIRRSNSLFGIAL